MISARPITVLVVDKHHIVRLGVMQLLGSFPQISVIAEASDGLEAIEMCRTLLPQVVLIDLELPKMSGLDAIRLIKQDMPEIRIVVLTSNDSEKQLLASLEAGVDGYCHKEAPAKILSLAIQGVSLGACWLDRTASAIVLGSIALPISSSGSLEHPANLTHREFQILKMVVDGHSNHIIAQALEIRVSTIKRHMNRIFKKMGVMDRTQAAVKALRGGFLK